MKREFSFYIDLQRIRLIPIRPHPYGQAGQVMGILRQKQELRNTPVFDI